MNVLVTDGENRSALAVTRSLGRHGCRVWVTGKERDTLASASRYCYRACSAPDPLQESTAYAQAIMEIAAREEISVIFPMTEQSVHSLNRVRSKLGKVALACAPQDRMDAVSDKLRLVQLATRLQIPVPSTVFISGKAEFISQRKSIGPYPVVVKPAFSKIADGDQMLSAGVMYAANLAELDYLYHTRKVLQHPSLIQELISGEGTGLFTLFDRGKHQALFAHRRLLEKPPSGGVSVLSESIRPDHGMVEAARKLLAEVGWSGIAMVEFKRDNRDGTAKLMEINGRFWGSLQLAIASGVNFPVLSLGYHLGQPAPPDTDYLVGHRLKWQFGILDHLLIRLKKGRHSAQLQERLPPLKHVIGELLSPGNSTTSSDVYDRHDLKPLLREATSYLRDLAG